MRASTDAVRGNSGPPATVFPARLIRRRSTVLVPSIARLVAHPGQSTVASRLPTRLRENMRGRLATPIQTSSMQRQHFRLPVPRTLYRTHESRTETSCLSLLPGIAPLLREGADRRQFPQTP